jgi:hypothetical protein
MYETAGYSSFWSSPLFLVAMYLYFSLCLFSIAQKIGHRYAWWAFIPILNLYQTVELAGKAWYWFIFMFIPFVNIVAFAWIWADIAKARTREPHWLWGILMLVPIVSFFVLLYLALGKPAYSAPPVVEKEQPTREPANV